MQLKIMKTRKLEVILVHAVINVIRLNVVLFNVDYFLHS